MKVWNRRPRYWARVVMDRETNKLVCDLRPEQIDALEISGDDWRLRAKFKSYKSVNYPDFDVCSTVLDEQFDLIIAEQVFEHLLWPTQAGKNIQAMLRPGGHFLITTPFLIKIHKAPYDCTRWTETGMRHMLEDCGFEQVHTFSWGNRACVRANFNRWVKYRPWHSLDNEPDFPAVVWAFAQKP